jgi:hypothetical protein
MIENIHWSQVQLAERWQCSSKPRALPASREFAFRKRRSKLKSHPKIGWLFNFGGVEKPGI